MKNAVIVVLVLAVFGLGGLVVYNKTKTNSPTAANSSTTSPSSAAQPKTANTLDLNSKGLTTVGPDIYNQTNTTTLILSNNNIQTLPSQMGNMTKLEVFKIDHNRLDGSLIGEIRKMPLTNLDVSYNNMTGAPAEIGQLNKLVTLNYAYNKLTGLPNEFSNLKNNLKELNLTGNPISADTLSKLKAELPDTNIIF